MKLVGVSLFILISLINQNLYAQQDLCDICETLKNNVVQITTTFEDGKEENGFGTVIGERNNKLYIITAKHVIYNLDERGFVSTDNKTDSVNIKFFYDQGKNYSATLLDLSNTPLDISLLEVEKPMDYIWVKDFYSKTISTGTKVWFIGRSGKWYIPTGPFIGSINHVSSNDELAIDINSIQPGTSGAPLISSNGIVGLIFEDASDGAKAYTIEKVMNLIINTWNYPWQMNLNLNSPLPSPHSNSVDAAWTAIINEKKERRKIDKLEDYVSKEQGIHLEEARKMFEGYLWANIGTYKFQSKYVQHFPEGKYIDQVENKVFGSQLPAVYLKLFPKGIYVEEAKKKLEEEKLEAEKRLSVEEENQLWTKIKDEWERGNQNDWNIKEYLEKYPQGKFVNQIEDLTWKQAVQKAEKTVFDSTGNYVWVATTPSTAGHWRRSNSNDLISYKEGYEKYLEYFPTGEYSNLAREKITNYKTNRNNTIKLKVHSRLSN